jgi:hypothetical protein
MWDDQRLPSLGDHRAGMAAHPRYISTVAKHGDNILDALRNAVTGNPWKPPVTC